MLDCFPKINIMNKIQTKRLEMLVLTVALMDKYPNIWNSIPKIVELKARLSELVLFLKRTSRQQEGARVSLGEEIKAVKVKRLFPKLFWKIIKKQSAT